MYRSEAQANQALAETRKPAAWAKPSTCKRVTPKGFFARLFA